MYKRSIVAMFVLALMMVLALAPAAAYAQAPVGSFVSGIACVNLDGVVGTASITFYNPDGSVKDTASNPTFLAPWQIFTPNQSGLGSGFQGSGVVSSDKKVACGLNSQTANGSAVTRVGTSSGLGADDIDTTVFATQITRNLGGFDTYVAIQNADSTPTDVTATYFDKTGASVFTQKRTLQGFGSTVWYQAAADANLPAAFIGSAKFVSTGGKLAGVIALYNAGSSNANAQFLSFNTVPLKAAASKIFLPRLAKNLSGVGYTSGWSCQNVGPGAADVKMTVNMNDQANGNALVSGVLTKAALGEGTAWSGYLGGATGNAALDAVTKGTGSAIVEVTGGTGKLACTANEDNRTTFAGQGISYNGIPDGKQTPKVFFAQIVALGASSFRGGFQIANTTATATTCTYDYTNKDGTKISIPSVPLAANGANSVFAESSLTSAKTTFNGSALVTCGQPIVGIYNLSIQGAAAHGDPFAANAGINQ